MAIHLAHHCFSFDICRRDEKKGGEEAREKEGRLLGLPASGVVHFHYSPLPYVLSLTQLIVDREVSFLYQSHSH